MTNVIMFRSEGRVVGFEAKGHALAGEEGNDIICSAISALTQTAIIGITELLRLDCAYETADGMAFCMLDRETSEKNIEKAELIFETMAMGLRSIARSYKTNLKVTEKEV